MQQTFVLHTQKSMSFVLRTEKSTQKAGKKSWLKVGKEDSKKGIKKVGKKIRQ